MSSLDTQLATTYDHRADRSDGTTATEPQPQSHLSIVEDVEQDSALLATFRFAVDDLRMALKRISVVHDDRTEMRFANGALLVRKCSDEFTCQVAVRLTEGHSEPIGFAMWDEELARLDGIQGELRVQVHGSGYEPEVVLSGTRVDLTEVRVEIRRDRLWDDDCACSLTGKVFSGALLAEAMRVVQPFARKRERNGWCACDRSSFLVLSKFGLACASPDYQDVCFNSAGLMNAPWCVPVEVVPKLRKFTRQFESFSVDTHDGTTVISDASGALFAWPTPVDIDARIPYHALKLDQFVSRVSAKEAERALKYIKAQVPNGGTVAALRVSKDDRSVWIETVVNGQVVRSPSAHIEVGCNTLDVEVVPQFTIDSLQKVFTGTKGTSIELRLYRHAENDERS